MATSGVVSPNYNLGMAANIATGVQDFFSAYNKAKDANVAQAMNLAKFKQNQLLNQAKIAQIHEQIAPIWFGLQKLQTIKNGVNANYVPDSVYKKNVNDLIDKVDTPQKLSFVNQAMMSANGATNPPAPISMSGGPTPWNQPGRNLQMPGMSLTALPTPPLAQPQPVQVQPAPSSEGFWMTPTQAKAYESFARDAALTSLGQGKLDVQKNISLLNAYNQQYKTYAGLYANAQTNKEKAAIADKMNQTKMNIANLNAALGIKEANIKARGTVTAAKIRAGAKTGGKNDPVLKNLGQQIDIYTTQLGKLMAPPTNPFEVPGARAAAVQSVQQMLNRTKQLYNQRAGKQIYKIETPQSGGSTSAPPAPSIPVAQPAPAPTQTATIVKNFTIPQGADQAAKDAISTEIRNLPNGTSFTLNGKSYHMVNGAPVAGQ